MSEPLSLKQPKALYLLVSVQMWECFSFYGMRALLVLYMIRQLQFSEIKAFTIYALYSCLVEFSGIFGGALADLFLGQKRAISIGGWLIAIGHIVLALEQVESYLFLGLAFIIMGSSLFSSNVSALLGKFYDDENDEQREEGFTLFYMGINIGALLATIICGFVGEKYGWHYGFGLAAIGMIIGNALLFFYRNILKDKGSAPRKLGIANNAALLLGSCVAAILLMIGLARESFFLSILPWVSVLFLGFLIKRILDSKTVSPKKLAILILFLAALTIFFAAEEQIGSSLLIFSESYVNRSLLGVEIPASALLSVNPITIILLGPFVNVICKKLQRHSGSVNLRIVIAFIIGSFAFILFAIGCSQLKIYEEVPLAIFIAGVILISLAELFIGPAVYSYAAEIANGPYQGTIMSLVPIGFSLSSILGGHLSQFMSTEQNRFASLNTYASGFYLIALLLCSIGIILGFIFSIAFRRRVYT